MIWIREKGKGIVMLDFKPDENGELGLYCQACESFNCWHVQYAWTLPETRRMFLEEIKKTAVVVYKK